MSLPLQVALAECWWHKKKKEAVQFFFLELKSPKFLDILMFIWYGIFDHVNIFGKTS